MQLADLDDDVAASETASAWPALVDLMSATSLLFLTFLCVMIYVAVRAQHRGDELQTTRQRLIDRLDAASRGHRLFTIDESETQFVRVVLAERATFESSGAWQLGALRRSGQDALDAVARVINDRTLQRLYREVRIVGYTDQDPYRQSAQAFSNWELSAARAAVIARYLVNRAGVDPCAISATGYGPYYPVKTEHASKEDSRRIEIEIIPRLASGNVAQTLRCDRAGDGSRRKDRVSE